MHERACTPCNVYGTLTTVRLWPITGRRHQLRRHCALLGTPIVGDDLYHTQGLLDAATPLERGQEVGRCAFSAGVVLEEDTKPARISVVPKRVTGEVGNEDSWVWDVNSAVPLSEKQVQRLCFPPRALRALVRRRAGLYLQAIAIRFTHPVTCETMHFRSPELPRFAKLRAKATRGSHWKDEKGRG